MNLQVRIASRKLGLPGRRQARSIQPADKTKAQGRAGRCSGADGGREEAAISKQRTSFSEGRLGRNRAPLDPASLYRVSIRTRAARLFFFWERALRHPLLHHSHRRGRARGATSPRISPGDPGEPETARQRSPPRSVAGRTQSGRLNVKPGRFSLSGGDAASSWAVRRISPHAALKAETARFCAPSEGAAAAAPPPQPAVDCEGCSPTGEPLSRVNDGTPA